MTKILGHKEPTASQWTSLQKQSAQALEAHEAVARAADALKNVRDVGTVQDRNELLKKLVAEAEQVTARWRKPAKEMQYFFELIITIELYFCALQKLLERDPQKKAEEFLQEQKDQLDRVQQQTDKAPTHYNAQRLLAQTVRTNAAQKKVEKARKVMKKK